jgi:hypothetical protein
MIAFFKNSIWTTKIISSLWLKIKKTVQKIYSLHINNQIMKENKKLIEQFYGESIYSMNCFERLLQ